MAIVFLCRSWLTPQLQVGVLLHGQLAQEVLAPVTPCNSCACCHHSLVLELLDHAEKTDLKNNKTFLFVMG